MLPTSALSFREVMSLIERNGGQQLLLADIVCDIVRGALTFVLKTPPLPPGDPNDQRPVALQAFMSAVVRQCQDLSMSLAELLSARWVDLDLLVQATINPNVIVSAKAMRRHRLHTFCVASPQVTSRPSALLIA